MSPQQSSDMQPLVEALSDEIERCIRWSTKYRKLWSFVTHTASTLVILGSALASFLQASKSDPQIALGLSLMVTAVAAVQLAFRQKWATYRTVHTEFLFLQIDLRSGYRDPNEIRRALEAVSKQHDAAVLEASGTFHEDTKPKSSGRAS